MNDSVYKLTALIKELSNKVHALEERDRIRDMFPVSAPVESEGSRFVPGETFHYQQEHDEQAAVDSNAFPMFVGAHEYDGFLRTDATMSYKDGGDFVTLGVADTWKGQDELVGVDSEATPDYIGDSKGNGVLRTDTSIDYVDGGDWVTLSVNDSWLKQQIADNDVLVAVDSDATAGYVGNTKDTGVLRTDTSIKYFDGGDWVRLSVNDSWLEDRINEVIDTGVTDTYSHHTLPATWGNFDDHLDGPYRYMLLGNPVVNVTDPATKAQMYARNVGDVRTLHGNFLGDSLYISQGCAVEGTQVSTSHLTGALTCAGGMGIAKQAYIGNDLHAQSVSLRWTPGTNRWSDDQFVFRCNDSGVVRADSLVLASGNHCLRIAASTFGLKLDVPEIYLNNVQMPDISEFSTKGLVSNSGGFSLQTETINLTTYQFIGRVLA